MSKMKSDRRPPLAKSPIRLRPRRVLQSNSSTIATSMQTPPGSLTKSLKRTPSWGIEEPELPPEYRTISCELRALAKMVRVELGNGESEIAGSAYSLSAKKSPLFERGRFYDEYSARRNERLKRKKGETGAEGKTPYNLGVTVESAKRNSTKKLESLRKSVSAAYSVERIEATPRYLLRSMSKENKKPPLPLPLNSERSVLGGEKKIGTRRVRRI